MDEQLYFPEGVTAGDLLPRLSKRGVVVAGGVHKEIKGASFVFSPSAILYVHLFCRCCR